MPQMSSGRTTALALVFAILLLEMAMSGAGRDLWAAIWSGPYALGQAPGFGGTLPAGVHREPENIGTVHKQAATQTF